MVQNGMRIAATVLLIVCKNEDEMQLKTFWQPIPWKMVFTLAIISRKRVTGDLEPVVMLLIVQTRIEGNMPLLWWPGLGFQHTQT